MAEETTLHQEYVTTGKPYEGGVSGLAAGALYRGPENSQGDATLPSDATSALPTGYNGLGYISQDGVGNSPSIESTDHIVWGGTVVLNSLNRYLEEYTFKCVELSPEVHKMVWGDQQVDGTKEDGMTVSHSRRGFDEVHVFVIIVVYADGSLGRQVIPKGKLSSVDTISFKDDELVGYAVTVKALPGGFDDDPLCTSREFVSAPGTVNAAAVTGGSTSGGSSSGSGSTSGGSSSGGSNSGSGE